MASYRVKGAAGSGLAVVIVAVWLLSIGGWIANIVKIFGSATEPVTALFIIRCVGVFAAPLGSVLGFL